MSVAKPTKKSTSYWLIELREIQWLHAKAIGARAAIKRLLRKSERREGNRLASEARHAR